MCVCSRGVCVCVCMSECVSVCMGVFVCVYIHRYTQVQSRVPKCATFATLTSKPSMQHPTCMCTCACIEGLEVNNVLTNTLVAEDLLH